MDFLRLERVVAPTDAWRHAFSRDSILKALWRLNSYFDAVINDCHPTLNPSLFKLPPTMPPLIVNGFFFSFSTFFLLRISSKIQLHFFYEKYQKHWINSYFNIFSSNIIQTCVIIESELQTSQNSFFFLLSIFFSGLEQVVKGGLWSQPFFIFFPLFQKIKWKII